MNEIMMHSWWFPIGEYLYIRRLWCDDGTHCYTPASPPPQSCLCPRRLWSQGSQSAPALSGSRKCPSLARGDPRSHPQWTWLPWSACSATRSAQSPRHPRQKDCTKSQQPGASQIWREIYDNDAVIIKLKVSPCAKFVQINPPACLPDCHEYWVVKIHLLVSFLPPNEPLFP